MSGAQFDDIRLRNEMTNDTVRNREAVLDRQLRERTLNENIAFRQADDARADARLKSEQEFDRQKEIIFNQQQEELAAQESIVQILNSIGPDESPESIGQTLNDFAAMPGMVRNKLYQMVASKQFGWGDRFGEGKTVEVSPGSTLFNVRDGKATQMATAPTDPTRMAKTEAETNRIVAATGKIYSDTELNAKKAEYYDVMNEYRNAKTDTEKQMLQPKIDKLTSEINENAAQTGLAQERTEQIRKGKPFDYDKSYKIAYGTYIAATGGDGFGNPETDESKWLDPEGAKIAKDRLKKIRETEKASGTQPPAPGGQQPPPAAKQYSLGQIIPMPDGTKWKIIGFYEDGEPNIVEVK